MESLPAEMHLKILRLLDHKNLATAQLGTQVQFPNFARFSVLIREFGFGVSFRD